MVQEMAELFKIHKMNHSELFKQDPYTTQQQEVHELYLVSSQHSGAVSRWIECDPTLYINAGNASSPDGIVTQRNSVYSAVTETYAHIDSELWRLPYQSNLVG